MKVAVYAAKGPAREVLRVVERPDPEPGPGEVRVRVAVSGVNPTDWKQRTPRPERPDALPWPEQVPNQDGAGAIDAVGDGVDEGRIGERVWVFNAAFARPGGTAAQYVCVPAERAIRLPEGISFDQGAGLGIPFITAHRCLFADGSIGGQTVLVTGGAGAVGNAAIQLARRAAARVIATASTPEKADLAAAAGAEVVLDYRAADFTEQLKAAAPGGVQRVVDVAIEANLPAYIDALSQHAVVAAYAVADGVDLTLPTWGLMSRNVTVRFVLMYHLTQEMFDAATADITAALEAGDLIPLPEHHFPLDEVAAAHEAVEQGVLGKVLVDIPPPL